MEAERTFENTVFGKNTNPQDMLIVVEFFNNLVNLSLVLYKRCPFIITYQWAAECFPDKLEGESKYLMEKSSIDFFNRYAVKNGNYDIFTLLNMIISNKQTNWLINQSYGIWLYANIFVKYFGCTSEEYTKDYKPIAESTELTSEVMSSIYHRAFDDFLLVGTVHNAHIGLNAINIIADNHLLPINKKKV